MYLLLGIIGGLGAVWKALGKLLHPVVKKWLSRDPTLGFVHLISLRNAALEQAALDAITKALRPSLPLRAAEVHIGRLTLSVGLLVGLRLRLSGVRAVLEWVPEDEWEDAVESIEAAVQGQSAKEAKAGVKLIDNKQKPKGLVPSFVAGLLESIISSGWVKIDGLELSLRGNSGAEVSVRASLLLTTSRCWAIEWRGTRAKAALQLAVQAGGQELISPANLDLTLKLPKVLKTLLMPVNSPKKQVKLEASLKKLAVVAHPVALCALMQVNELVSQFSEWKARVERTCSEVRPLSPGQREAYLEALQGGEDVSQWERNITCGDILRVYSEWKQWEVPGGVEIEEWLEKLTEEQKPVRSIDATVSVDAIHAEALGQDTKPGDGFAVHASKLRLEAHVLDVQGPQPPSNEESDPALSLCLTGSAQDGPAKVRAKFSLASLSVTCDSNDDFAMPVLEPCELSATATLHELDRKLTVHAATQFQKAGSATSGPRPEAEVIVATVSSRSVWKLQSVAAELVDATVGARAGGSPRRREPAPLSLASKRRKEHMKELEKVFRKLDADGSGQLDVTEVHQMVADLYGEYMTKKEIGLASEQFFNALDVDGSGSVSLDEIQAFFGETSGDSAKGMVCLRLYEFNLPVRADFNALSTFRDMAGAEVLGSDGHDGTKPGVLQLQWVRTIQNYREAKRTWEADIAPHLAPRFKEWRLNDTMRAIDFWNDPMFSLTGNRSVSTGRDFGAVLSLQIAGISLRLADSQHACSIPRVRLDMEQVSLEGGIRMLSHRVIPWCEGVSAELNIHATYFNERGMSVEPFIEPWKIALRAQGDDVSLRAEEHLVMNVTPPFLQAVTVATASLQSLEGEYEVQGDHRFVTVWVENRTNCDIKVSARGPAGQGKTVFISRGDCHKKVPVEIAGARNAASMRLQSSNDSWKLAIEGEDRMGTWRIDEGIDFSITGRQFFRAGDRLIAANTSVDVHFLAPILTLSGTTTLCNMTQKTLTLSDGAHYNIMVRPRQSWQCCIGGGLQILLPVAVEGREQTFAIDMPKDGHDDVEGDWKIACGYRFIMNQREDELRNTTQDTLVKDCTMVCVPMLSIFNALPLSLYCIMGSALREEGRQEAEDPASQVLVKPGGTQAFDDADPDKPVTVELQVEGFRYSATIPADVLKTSRGVLRMQAATRKQKGKRAVSLEVETVEAYTERTGLDSEAHAEAPLLDVEFNWAANSAVMVVYARYWLANKTGWELEAAADMKVRRRMGLQCEVAKPGPLLERDIPGSGSGQERRSSTLSLATGREDRRGSSSVPPTVMVDNAQIAMMRLKGEELHIKLQWRPCGELWSWDEEREQSSLQHWTGPQEEQETGWSAGLAVEFAGTAGVAELPRADEQIGVLGTAGAVLGVSVTDLAAPFQRTKLITVVPRYVVRNDLNEAVQIWPSVGASRRAPVGEAPEDLPVVQPGACLAIDAMPYSSLLQVVAQRGREMPMISVRSCAEGEQEEGGGKWSLQVHLSMVGDTTFIIGSGGRGDPLRVVRASVQRSEATIFVVLVKGRWPFGIENRSLVHTVAFHQKGAEDLDEWVLNPCETRNFVFPDPDQPKHIIGRICGAGSSLCQHYELDDLSRTDKLPGLRAFGQREAALNVALRVKAGHTLNIVISDRKEEAVEAERSRSGIGRKPIAAPKDGGGIMKLALDVFVMGIHASLIDTRHPTPVELLAFTVDYIQLQKQQKQRAVTFTIHSAQLDDFGQDDCFVFGPAMSGLNSQRSSMNDSKTFTARPLFQVSVAGPRNPLNPVFDTERGMLSLQAVHLNLQPMEANVDVPRLVALGMTLKNWLSVIDSGVSGSTASAAGRSLRRALAPGFPAPQRGGDTVCYIANYKTEALGLLVDLKLRRRQGDAGKDDTEGEALQNQLSQLSARVWKPFRGVIDFLARMGTSFAEASPRFKFSALTLHHLTGNLKVVKASVVGHYQSQIMPQVAKTFGSLQVLGDPVNLLDDISSSFTTFIQKTREELQGEREGLGEGVQDLAGGVLGGALGSVSKVSGSLKDLVGSVTGRPIGSDKRATNISDGIDLGLMSLANGVSEAVTGLVEDPMQLAQTDGLAGLCKGSLRGTAGLFTRPVEGFLGAVEKVSQGAENQVRGVHRGYGGLRRPPRVAFQLASQGLRPLDQTFFWPQWTMTVLSVSLPILWRERKVKQLVVFPQQAGTSDDNEVSIVRGEYVDTWALQGQSPENDFAIGRTGNLRGPFQLQVDAMVDGNMEMTKLFRVTVGSGELPLEELVRCLGTRHAHPLPFSIHAQRSPVLGEAFSAKQDEVIGEVVVELAPAINEKILPKRFTDTVAEGLETLGPAATGRTVRDGAADLLGTVAHRLHIDELASGLQGGA